MSATLARLAAARPNVAIPAGDRLTDVAAPAINPGALEFRTYKPADLPPGAPLVIVLHGCTQSAAGYDHGSGWSSLADAQGFMLLFAEQTQANNANRCFNWFVPADIARTGGEAGSIAAAVTATVAQHRLDAAHVYVTGLSAGGAMTAVMLATWPELFAGGAIIGGLPYGVATSMGDALSAMRGQGESNALRLSDLVRAAAPAPRRRPTVSLWHGTGDQTVVVANMDRLGEQWRGVHNAGGDAVTTSGPGWERRSWTGEDGRAVIEEWRVAGMGHGVPIDTAKLGAAGPYMLDVGLSSTTEIARSWGLITRAESAAKPRSQTKPARAAIPLKPVVAGVQSTIESALKSAGLMR
ncbi:MAG TPA: PHB depolymerase family esterase [Sphingomonas sp.]